MQRVPRIYYSPTSGFMGLSSLGCTLGGRTPWQVWYERTSMTPFHDEVEAKYDRSAERLRHPVYQLDLQLMHAQQRVTSPA